VSGNLDFLVVKTDGSGEMLWSRTYGGAKAEFAFSLVEADDGGYVVAGYTLSYGAGRDDCWLIKLDSSGNLEWSQTYGGLDDDGAVSLIHTSDGGYAFLGMLESFGHSDTDDFWRIKTDDHGNMQWNRTYGGKGNDYGFAVVEAPDEGYVLVGGTNSFAAGIHDAWLIKTDASGNVLWNRTYGGTGEDGASALVQTSDGGYAFCGSTDSYGNRAPRFLAHQNRRGRKRAVEPDVWGAEADLACCLVETATTDSL
jgi:hypothetical protein